MFKNNRFKRQCALFLLFALLISSFSLLLCSCGKEIVLEDDGVKLDSNIYRYWLASFKDRFISSYSDIEDTEECWNRETEDGSTVGEYVENYTLNYAKNAICSLRLYRDYKLALSNSVKKEIDDYIDEVISYRYAGVSADFNAALLDNYGITVETLRKAYEIEAKIAQLREYLFGSNGIMAVDEAALADYYAQNYVCIQVIYVNTAFRYVTDEDGKRQTDLATGYYKTEALTEEEKAEKEKKADEAYERIQNGEAFSDVMTSYSDLELDDDYKEGIYFPAGDYTVLTDAGFSATVFSKILAMEEEAVLSLDGEEVNPASPGRYFIKRCPLKEGGYRDSGGRLGAQFANLPEYVQTERFNTLLQKEMQSVKVNEELISSLRTVNVKRGFSFLTGKT